MSKICSPRQLADRVKQERRVIFTHGAFDLFHPGHLYLLKKSASMGGRLVVGVESSQSVVAYKKRRPVFGESYRMKLISGFEFVDHVVYLNFPCEDAKKRQDLYLRFYLSFKPDVVTHGRGTELVDELKRDCRMLGIKSRDVGHYRGLSSSYYKDMIKESW